MTLNEWEQSNIEVLTSREMGEWLGRRENRLLDKIKAEIYEEFMTIDGGVHDESAKKCMRIIDKYGESEVKE